MFLSNEEIVEASNNPLLRRYLADYRGNSFDREWPAIVQLEGPLSTVDAEALIARVREQTLRNRMRKINRPWFIVDITSKLDASQNWIGIEFETGFNNKAHYDQVVTFVMDQCNYAVCDYEGCGYYPVEITFSPQNESKLLDGTSDMHRLLAMMEQTGIVMADKAGRMVGTHVNISTPTSRANSYNSLAVIASSITHAIYPLTDDQKRRLFGRRPYGYLSAMQDGASTKHWIEGKLFDSEPNTEIFNGYMQVTKRLADLIESLSQQIAKRQFQSYDHFNLRGDIYAYLCGNGETPTLNV